METKIININRVSLYFKTDGILLEGREVIQHFADSGVVWIEFRQDYKSNFMIVVFYDNQEKIDGYYRNICFFGHGEVWREYGQELELSLV